MSGFAQGLLAGFSTVDQAMTRRKELGLREAQLAQQQKNNERDFEFAQSQFEHNKNVDQRDFDYKAKVDDRDYALKEREFNANQNYRNASLGMEQQRLRMQKYNQRRLEYNDMLARDQPVMAALGKAVDAGERDAAMRLYGQLSEGNPQRQLSRKVKFSNNWQKQKRKIQRLHSCIANIRRDYLHKVTTAVSKNHAMIVIEDLKVSNMSKSAAGSVSQPGRNVRAKSGLNRSILDQGWYEMRRQLEYKQLWRGGQVLAVPPAYTSQRCACCGHTAKENRLSQSKFRCQACGYTANADVNGARNILAAGHAVLACGEMVQSGRPLKQEPTEMIQATA